MLRDLIKGTTHVLYHIAAVTLSAGFALSLPWIAKNAVHYFLVYWSRIENNKIILITIEIAVAIFLISFFAFLKRRARDRKLAEMTTEAGLVHFFPAKGRLTQRRIRKLKERHALARNIMLIGSTGYRTFVDSKGDLHKILTTCLEAKIMLMDPYSEGASARARALLQSDATIESFKAQIKESIDFLKKLRAAHKNVRLKLYSDIPHLKLAIMGDYIWIRHYHTNLHVRTMPEYAFKHNQNDHGLYTLFYQYFTNRWRRHDIPEYDLETDELIYIETNGTDIRRERYDNRAGMPDLFQHSRRH